MNSIQQFLLCSVYCNSLSDSYSDNLILPYLADRLNLDEDYYIDKLFELEKQGLVSIRYLDSKKSGEIRDTQLMVCNLTSLGRSKIKVVLVGGVFDLLHVGHLHTLKSAKLLGDVLVIVVATNSTVNNLKKNRKIYHDENSRLELVSSIRFVDLAIIGGKNSIYDTVDYVKPDIIALGYDQVHNVEEMKKNCLERGLKIEVVRLSSPIPRLKSSLIKSELGNSFYDF